MQAASRQSWETTPMPARRERLNLSLLYSVAEGERIGLGHVPRGMDDRWFIFCEDDWLYFHRSWTGFCIYACRLDRSRGGVAVVEGWVNGDAAEYRSPGPEEDARSIEQLIAEFLLSGRDPLT